MHGNGRSRRARGWNACARALGIALCAGVAGLAVSAGSPAEAATFPVYTCYAGSSSLGPGWQIAKGASYDGNVTLYPACEDAGQGLVARNVWTSGSAPNGAAGSFDFYAPSGTSITAVHYDYAGNGGGGWQGQLWRSGWGPDWFGETHCFPYTYGGCTGNSSWARLDDPMPYGTSKLSFQFVCATQSGCTRSTNFIGSMHLRNIQVDLDDPSNPGVGSEGGSLWRSSVRGNADIGWGAGDGESGISHTWAEVDHRWTVAESYPGCDNRQLRPCPDSGGYGSIDTTRLGDGRHTVFVYATNGAGMTTAPDSAQILVDNTGQAAPGGLAVSGAAAWHSSPSFTASYGVPGTTAPLDHARYELCRLDGSDCRTGAAELSGTQTLTMPAMGEWHVRYGDFTDAAGNGGDWSDWSDPMRYDPTVPGNSAPERANGWINRSEYRGYTIRMDDAWQAGPSGVAGYAVTTDGSLPGSTVTVPVTDQMTYSARYDLAGLAEGVTTLRARAISGAGVPAPDDRVQPATIKVDLTSPTATVDGAPTGSDTTAGSAWQGHAVNLTFTGVDQPNLSGMAPTSDGIVTHGAYVEYRVDGGDWQPSPGDTAELSLGPTGDHLVDYRAVDLAGNASQTHTLRIKVDRDLPGATHITDPGWISASGYTLQMAVDRATLGPSGLRGFSVTRDGSSPSTTDVSAGPDGNYLLSDLAEGVTTVRARAIGGAGVAARETDVGALALKVDRTAPGVSVGGLPPADEWQHAPVSLGFTAADQAGLSGLDHLEYQLDDGAVQDLRFPAAARARHASRRSRTRRVASRQTGPQNGSLSITVGTDGAHTVHYRAVDTAGNASTPRSARILIDTSAPIGGMQPPDPSDPTKVTFYVSDQCISAAQIQLRPAGGDWHGLDTQIAGDQLIAHVPDQAYAEGDYELRAIVTDCAGNTSTLTQWWAGQRAGQTIVVHLPLRIATMLRAWRPTVAKVASRACRTVKTFKVVRGRDGRRHRRLVRRKVCGKAKKKAKRPAKRRAAEPRAEAAAAGGAVKVAGTLTTADGQPLAAAPVDLQAQILGTRQWTTVASGQTDTGGNIALTAPGGPSRLLRLAYSGTQVLLSAASPPVTVSVPARSSFAVDHTRLRNGQTVHFHGALLGGYIPAHGRQVELDGYNPVKRQWVPVATPRTDAHGRWTARYRFTATRGRVVYRFRLRITPESDYPFALGYGARTIAVTVTG